MYKTAANPKKRESTNPNNFKFDFICFQKYSLLASVVNKSGSIRAAPTFCIEPTTSTTDWSKASSRFGPKAIFQKEPYFKIISFDDFVRLSASFNSYAPDFLIIDEAEKLSGFDSELARLIKRVNRRHLLIITDNKPQNRLIEFYTMVGLVDHKALTPLWEFSYQHCLFDSQVLDKVVGYYNQDSIIQKLKAIMLRREKDEVSSQLQKINRLIVPVNLKEAQQMQQQKMAEEALFLLNKKIKTTYDWQKMAQLLVQMKAMASLVLFVKQNQGESAKYIEFKHYLLDKINIHHQHRKIIVFAEKEEAQRQLVHFFREQRIPTDLINKNQNEEKRKAIFNRFEECGTSAVLLAQEGIVDILPSADILIYFDLSLNQNAVEKRYSFLQREKAVCPPSVVQFLSKSSIENSLFQLLNENTSFFKEICSFLSSDIDEKSTLSEEAVLEIKKILQGLIKEKGKLIRKNSTGQTSLFVQNDDHQLLSLSSEEHNLFENTLEKKEADDIKMEKLLQNAHAFLSDLYTIQTGETLSWKIDDIDIKIEKEEIVLRIKRW